MKILLPLLSLVGLLPFLMACSDQPRPSTPATPSPSTGNQGAAPARDPHSFSHPDEVAVEHLKLDLGVDFDKRQLNGRASLRLNNRTGANRLFLDTRDLTIQRVTLDDGVGTQFTDGRAVEFLGRPLEIDIRPETKWVHVEYTTQPGRRGPAVARSGADGGRRAPLPAHPVAGHPGPHLGPLPGQPGRAHDLRGHRARAPRTCSR